ncbi:MAG: FCD domain-containing protein, partial [Armatimonadota bacterium]|nr:FCD domain-containing protein [Armatimonadota bacterium]
VRGRLRPLLARLLQNRGRTTRSFRELARLTAAIRSRDPDRAEAALREHVASLRQEGREAGWLLPGP